MGSMQDTNSLLAKRRAVAITNCSEPVAPDALAYPAYTPLMGYTQYIFLRRHNTRVCVCNITHYDARSKRVIFGGLRFSEACMIT